MQEEAKIFDAKLHVAIGTQEGQTQTLSASATVSDRSETRLIK